MTSTPLYQTRDASSSPADSQVAFEQFVGADWDSVASPLTTLRLGLHDQGYQPVPVTSPDGGGPSAGKRPVMDNWRNICAGADGVEIKRWEFAQPTSTNTGLLCGQIVGVDIDVPVPDLAEKIEPCLSG